MTATARPTDATLAAVPRPAAPGDPAPRAAVVLDHEAAFLRRRVLTAEDGTRLALDLPRATALAPGTRLVTEAGHYEVRAAQEPLMAVAAADARTLARLAWHVGNRHVPCRIEADRLVLRDDHVLSAMLEGLGATVSRMTGPFHPEGGAYGTGRVAGHSHGPHDHGGHDHGVHDHGGHHADG